MATLITRTSVRQEMLRRVPVLGRALTADSVGANSLTHTAEYYRNRAGPTEYENQIVHRYNLADPDRWRRILSLNSPATDGIINVDGPVYVDQTDKAYERLGIHPDDLNSAIAEGQRRQRLKTNIALTRADRDLDCETAGVLFWNGTNNGSAINNATVTKATSFIETGTQALSVVGTGVGAYCRGPQIGVIPGQLVYMACYVYSGLTAGQTVKLRDAVNGGYIGDTRTIPISGRFLMTWIMGTVPTNCTAIQIEFAPANGGTILVDTCFGPYQPGQTAYPYGQPGGLDEAYKLRFIRPVHYNQPLSTAGFFNAESVVFEGDLTTPENWALEAFRRDVNSSRLRLIPSTLYPHPPAMGLDGGFCPLFLALEARVSDYEPLLTEASTTSQDLDECACYSLRYLFENLSQRHPGDVRWTNGMQEYARWAVIEDMARPPQPRMPPARLHQVNA